ncbi:MAG: polysaccharide deacetylase family protein [Kiritimatiellaeota bacterium]|nr:polysaccharide deacetylase family protein [Kiritimatiellota bacterium]
MKHSLWLGAALLALGLHAAGAEPGTTRVARWAGDARGAFVLMFDDSWPSHFQVAAPELAKRGLTATFYINPGKGEYQKFRGEWESNVWKQGMAYGVHTLTHKGVKDFADADREIGECARIIRSIVPGTQERLVSYGRPGVGKGAWNITDAQEEELLKKHRLINRPPFTGHGAVYHLKTTAEMLALADKATANGSMEYLVIHGVERINPKWSYQDFWALKQSVFLPLLDGLKERSARGALWVTDHLAAHQYERERDTAEVQVLSLTDRKISLSLKSKTDPQFYDQPLTLVTTVPTAWKQCRVTQGTNQFTRADACGELNYTALPRGALITLTPEN